MTHSAFESNKNAIFSQKSLFVGVEPHVCWATLMISVVLTANLQAFHKHSITVFQWFLNIEEFIPTRLSIIILLKESKADRVITF